MVAPGTAVVADALAGIPVPVVSLHWADLALISAGKIWMYNSTFETLQVSTAGTARGAAQHMCGPGAVRGRRGPAC